jgi:hypothetical protein
MLKNTVDFKCLLRLIIILKILFQNQFQLSPIERIIRRIVKIEYSKDIRFTLL